MSNDTTTASKTEMGAGLQDSVSLPAEPDATRAATWTVGGFITLGWLALWFMNLYNNFILEKWIGVALTAVPALLPFVVIGGRYLIEHRSKYTGRQTPR